jgi:hypothetical protein
MTSALLRFLSWLLNDRSGVLYFPLYLHLLKTFKMIRIILKSDKFHILRKILLQYLRICHNNGKFLATSSGSYQNDSGQTELSALIFRLNKSTEVIHLDSLISEDSLEHSQQQRQVCILRN